MTRTFDPFREMDRFLADAVRTPASLAMPMDLYREGEAFLARIDLPGVEPGSIDIDVEDRTLTIRAERRSVNGQAEQKWLVHERPSGTFARQLTLGHGLALDQITADYSDGVLSLTITVAEEAKPRKIQVAHTGGQTQIEGSVESEA